MSSPKKKIRPLTIAKNFILPCTAFGNIFIDVRPPFCTATVNAFCMIFSSFSFSMIFSSLSFSVVLLLLHWPNILLLFLLLPWNTFLLKMFCSFLYFIFLFRWPNIFLLQIIFPFLFFSGQTFTSFLFFLITFLRLKTKNLRYLDQN